MKNLHVSDTFLLLVILHFLFIIISILLFCFDTSIPVVLLREKFIVI